MDKKYTSAKIAALVFTASLSMSSMLSAQENPEQMLDLLNRVGAIEAENHDLRGQIEETRHELTKLTQRVETLSADIDYRLNNPESGANLAPLPLGKGESKTSTSSPTLGVSSSASEEYEKARTLLEQGDYEAAEHAFSAFVAGHPKDEQAGAAQYWLGVTFFVRGLHEKAAAAFAKGYKTYPKSSKAGDNLLKLAKSLAALDRKADACTTLDQLSSEHPKAHVKEVASDRKNYGCK